VAPGYDGQRVSPAAQRYRSHQPGSGLPTTSAHYWLVRVDARGGGLGSGSPGLDAGWLPQRLVFAARGAGPVPDRLGQSQRWAAEYSVDTLIPGYRHEVALDQLAVPIGAARLGATRVLAGIRQPANNSTGKAVLMWASLVLGVAVLARMAFVLTRKMSQPEQP
jgi:hypothetical protein